MQGAPLVDRAVAEDEDGRRIDVVVADWLGEARARSQARIASEQVRTGGPGGPPIAKSHRVHSGERITVLAPPPQQPPAAADPVPVRWRDEHLAVVAKPAGLVVHRGAGTRGAVTLVETLRQMEVPLAASGDPDRPGIVHRLDRGTSGLLVVACSEPARAGLSEMFRRHAVERRYWAIVDGHPDPPAATIDAPIARATSNRARFRVDASGRPAVSHYDVVDGGPGASIVTVRLETGRTHQVRVHMASVGHPVSGDRAYGASGEVAQRLGLGRPALHAQHLAFDHPVTGDRVEVAEPLPRDLDGAREQLSGR